MKFRRWLGLAAIILVPVGARSQTPAPPSPAPHYDIRLSLDPGAHRIQVTGTLRILATATLPDTLAFYLDRQLRVESFGGGSGAGYRLDREDAGIRYLPEAMRVLLPRSAASAGVVEIPFAYAGRITEWPEWSANVIGASWTELGLYFPWFPLQPDLGSFTYHLEVTTDPALGVFAMGTPSGGPGHAVFDRTSPTNDLVVVAAPGLRVREARFGAGSLRIASIRLSPATSDSIAADLSRLDRLYSEWFGPVAGDQVLVASERARGGGYARRGGLFLAGLDDDGYLASRTAYLGYLGHELAHRWWYRADTDTDEDWLNEGMAEYSALLALRTIAGEAEFDRRLLEKRKTAAGAAPVVGSDRNGPGAEAVLYSKAPARLGELEARLGTARFLAFARTLHDRDVRTTAAFLATLERVASPGVRRWFEGRLRD